MNENNEYTEVGYVKPKFGTREWLENFWYHYKWHSIVAAFLVITLTISLLQTCSKVSYDINILYAGSYEIERGGTSYTSTIHSLKRVCEDFNDDGDVNVSLRDLYMLSNAEIDKILEENPSAEINQALLNENNDTFYDLVLMGDYYLYILSVDLFEGTKTMFDTEIFADLTPYVEGTDAVMYSNTAIYLSSLDFYALQGISDFPAEDTVICIKALTSISSNKAVKNQKKAIDVLKNMISYDIGG